MIRPRVTTIVGNLAAASLWTLIGLTHTSVALSQAKTLTFHDCKHVHHYGRIVFVVYCPAAIPPEALADFALAMKNTWLERYGWVQYRFFSTEVGLPETADGFDAKSDEWFEKYEIGNATFNPAQRYAALFCKKPQSEGLDDCTDVLKRVSRNYSKP